MLKFSTGDLPSAEGAARRREQFHKTTKMLVGTKQSLANSRRTHENAAQSAHTRQERASEKSPCDGGDERGEEETTETVKG